MADEYRIDSIPNTDTDWTETDSLGRQWSGQTIQEFIRDGIKIAETATAEKIAATYFDSSTLTQYQFKSEADKEAWLNGGGDSLVLSKDSFNFSGTVHQMSILNRLSSTSVYFTTTAGTAILRVGFLSQEKGITAPSWSEVMEDAFFSVYVDKGSTGSYTTVIEDVLVLNGNDFSYDVFKYLATGSNRVRIFCKGALTGVEGNIIFQANLTTMYLSPSNFTWNKPFIQGTVYSLGGMNIGGNLQKTLKIKVTSESYEKEYDVNIGSATYITNSYFWSGMEFPETGSGVYNVEIWLDADGLESDHLSYNIICVASDDIYAAELVAINEVSEKIINGADGVIFKYTTYNKNTSTSSPTVIIKLGEQELINETLSGVTTGANTSYSSTLEIESEASDLSVTAEISLGNTESVVIPLDNSASFPSVKGYSFYLNAATRSNTQGNRDSIINEVTGEAVSSVITGISYSDLDGWTTDEAGRKCLLIPAMSKVEIEEKFLSSVGTGKTIEMAFKVANAADYNENIITISPDPESSTFQGIIIKPTNVCLHSRNLNSNDLAQSYNLKDEELVHLVITIVKNYKTNYGNLAQIYVGGVKKTSFSFTGTDSFVNSANLILGSNTADLYLYKLRVYDNGFGWQDSIQNFVNCLPSATEKIAAWNKITSVLDDSYKVDYDAVSGKFNTMVIEMLDGAVIPSVLTPSSGQCNVSFNIIDSIPAELDSDFTSLFSGDWILNQTIEGQGTTAMTYYRWNFRWKLDETYNKRRITAKKNYASSMHSHKMGATRMFNDLHNAVCGFNEAGARVAVFQYPVYGFTRTLVDGTTDQYVYTFIGLYTVGPDKGDKNTFGFGSSEFKSTLMHLEGTDHTPMAVGFDYPWAETKYSAAREAMGAITKDGDVSAAWEVGAAGKLEPDSDSDQDAVKAMLDAEFKPAYEVVYNNSTAILGISVEDFTTMNSDPVAWRKNMDASEKSYSELEFWVDGVYDLYYYNQAESIYKTNGINLLEQLGVTEDDLVDLDLTGKNELFRTKRREAFMSEWENYWDKDDAIFHDVFCELIAATDNFKKNNYPYKFKLLADGGKWRRRQDDLDSILDINNQGFAAKKYSVLFGDKSSSGSIFRGENSIFHTLVHECYKDEKKNMAHRILNAMVDLAPDGQSKIEKLLSYVRSTFWDKAQDYFTKSAYNADAEWTYEEAWPQHTAGNYKNDVNPLQQSLGSHYEAERAWVELRMIFAASYYNWGPFATDNGDDTSTGQISFRAAGGKTYTITPAIDFNPTILIGQSDLATAGDRIYSGNNIEVIVPDMGNNDTHVYIQGADWLEDLGDLSDLAVSVDNAVLTIGSKRLRRLKVGDETPENVTSNVSTLVIGECPSLEEIEARNLSSLSGTVDLSRCPRLRKALFSGTSLAEIAIPSGSKLNILDLPETLTTLSLVNLPEIEGSGLTYGSLTALTYLRVEGNPGIDGFGLLKAAVSEDGALREIRVIGFDYSGDATDVDLIAKLGEGGYFGIDEIGEATTGLPVLEGTLNIDGAIYEDTEDMVKEKFPGVTLNVSGGYYIRFADPEVLNVLLTNGVGDGIGITAEQAAAVTSIGTWFNGNTTIETFDEFEKFTGHTYYLGASDNNSDNAAFYGCSSLTSIILPPSITYLGTNCFRETILESINLENITHVGSYTFRGCNLGGVLCVPNLVSIGNGAFNRNNITEVSSLGKITSISGGDNNVDNWPFYGNPVTKILLPDTLTTIGQNTFRDLSVLEECNIPKSVTSIGNWAFYGCTSLSFDELSPPNLTSLGQNAFYGVSIKKMDISGLTSLPSASSTTQNFGKKDVLEEVVLGEGLTSIPEASFYGYTALSSINLENISTINKHAFQSCSNLAIEVNMPKLTGTLTYGTFGNSGITKVVSLGSIDSIIGNTSSNAAFVNCKSLTSVILPDTLTYIGDYIFYNCTELTECAIPDNVTSIGPYAFSNCKKITSINLPTGVKSIGKWAFQHTGITSIKIPEGVTRIEAGICSGCSSLTLMDIPSTTSYIAWHIAQRATLDFICRATAPPSTDSNFFTGATIKVIYVPDGTTTVTETTTDEDGNEVITEVTKTIVELYKEATNWSTYADRIYPISVYEGGGLSEIITFEDSVVEALCLANFDYNGDGYFMKAEAVSVTSIRGKFVNKWNIYKFKEFQYFTGIKSMDYYSANGYGMFTNTNLTVLALPPAIETIQEKSITGCTSLIYLLCYMETPATISGDPFSSSYVSANLSIYVPDESVDLYKEDWSIYADKIKPLSEYTE